MATANGVDYGFDMQKLYLELFLSDATSFIRCQSIFDHQLFDRKLQPAAEFINDYVNNYNVLPTPEMVNAASKVILCKHDDLIQSHFDWLLKNFETFTRHKGLERAIIEANDMLEEGNYGEVEEKIKKAVQVSLTHDIGTSYYDDPRARLQKLKESNGNIKTGWKSLDDKIYNMSFGELNIWAGSSGTGKSLTLANLAINFSQSGYNVVYMTFELAETLVAMRMDTMLTSIPSKGIFANIDTVDDNIRALGRTNNPIQIKYLSSGSNVNDIKAYIKEYEMQAGLKVDILLLDYLDLIHPTSKRIDLSNAFLKDKIVSEQIRNYAADHRMLVCTASQLNRSAVDEVEFNHSHIAGGKSKIDTADNVFGILLNKGLKERGKIIYQCIKTRNSGGVGSNIELDFNAETMRISDSIELVEHIPVESVSSVLSNIRRKSVINEPSDDQPDINTQQTSEPIIETVGSVVLPPVSEAPLGTEKIIKAETSSSRLRGFLNNGGI